MTRFAIFLALVLASCGKKDDKPTVAAGSGSGSAAVPAAGSGSSAPAGSGSAASMRSGSGSAGSGSASAGSGSATAGPELPTEEDFEQQAKTDIDDKNVDAKLTAIEKELGQ